MFSDKKIVHKTKGIPYVGEKPTGQLGNDHTDEGPSRSSLHGLRGIYIIIRGFNTPRSFSKEESLFDESGVLTIIEEFG